MKGVGEVTSPGFGNEAPGPALPAGAQRRKEGRFFTDHLLILPTNEAPPHRAGRICSLQGLGVCPQFILSSMRVKM